MPLPPRRIGILTGGGDAPGLNAVIRAVVRSAATAGIECIGIEDSFDGLIFPGRTRRLEVADVTGIHRLGGTILGTTNRGNPFAYPTSDGAEVVDYSGRVLENFNALELSALIVIGGDGTMAIAHQCQQMGMPVVCIPKTIDNDIAETTMTFGFDTAVSFATEAIDRLHATASAHHRVMVVEVMGRYSGWIALFAAIAGGADAALIPEIPFDLSRVAAHVNARELLGARSSIVVVAEGAAPVDGARSIVAPTRPGQAERLGGVAERITREIEPLVGKEARYVVLGHLQRGGSPVAFDRVLATRFGSRAVSLVRQHKFGIMVALRSAAIVDVPLDLVVGRTKSVPLDSDIVGVARDMGMCLGD